MLARLCLTHKHAYTAPASNCTYMTTLQTRMEEFVEKTKLTKTEIAAIAGVTPSAVSQWLGSGGKTIHSIGNIEAAIKLERSTGYSALWLAKGNGPKLAEREASTASSIDYRSALQTLAKLIAPVPPDTIKREQVELLFRRLARSPEQVDEIADAFAKLLEIASSPTTSPRISAAGDFEGVQENKGLGSNGQDIPVPKRGDTN